MHNVHWSFLWDRESVYKSLRGSREAATSNLRVQWKSEGILGLSQEVNKDKTGVYRDYSVNYL